MTVTPVIPVKQHHHASKRRLPTRMGAMASDPQLTPGAVLVALVLDVRGCAKRPQRVLIPTIARDTGRCDRQVQRDLAALVAAGWLTVKHTGRSSAYLLHRDASPVVSDTTSVSSPQINPHPVRVNQSQDGGVDQPQPQPHIDVADVSGIVAILDADVDTTSAADRRPGEPLPIGAHLANVNPEPRGQEQPHPATRGWDVDMAVIAVCSHLPQHLRPKRNTTVRRLVADRLADGMTAAEIGCVLTDRIGRLRTPPQTPGYVVRMLADPDLWHTPANPAAKRTTTAAPPPPPIVRHEHRSLAAAIAAATPRDEAEEPLTDADRAATQQLLDGFRSGSTYRKTCRTIERTRTRPTPTTVVIA